MLYPYTLHTYCSVSQPSQHPQHQASGDLADCEPGLPLLHRHCGNLAEGNHTPTTDVLYDSSFQKIMAEEESRVKPLKGKGSGWSFWVFVLQQSSKTILPSLYISFSVIYWIYFLYIFHDG